MLQPLFQIQPPTPIRIPVVDICYVLFNIFPHTYETKQILVEHYDFPPFWGSTHTLSEPIPNTYDQLPISRNNFT